MLLRDCSIFSLDCPCAQTPEQAVLLNADFLHLSAGTHGQFENLVRFFVRDLYSITVSIAPGSDPSSSDIDEVLLETNWTNRDGQQVFVGGLEARDF